MNIARTINGCVLVSSFTWSVTIPAGIESSIIGLKKFCNHCRNQNASYKEKEEEAWENSVVKKAKLDTIVVLLSNGLIDSYISHGEFVSVNNV